jgi:hypothetical protein
MPGTSLVNAGPWFQPKDRDMEGAVSAGLDAGTQRRMLAVSVRPSENTETYQNQRPVGGPGDSQNRREKVVRQAGDEWNSEE